MAEIRAADNSRATSKNTERLADSSASECAPVIADSDGLIRILRFHSASDGVLVLDLEDRLVYANRAFSEIVGLDSQEFIGQHYPFPWCIEGEAEVCEERFRFLESKKARKLGIEVFAWQVRHVSGRCVPVWMSRKLLLERQGGKLGHAIFFNDRSETPEKREARPLQAVTPVDDLTGLLRRIALGLEKLGVPSGLLPTPYHLAIWPEFNTLSPREREVLLRLLEGSRVPTIARTLHISPHTVRNHLQSVFRKVGVGSQAELIEKLRSVPSESPVDCAESDLSSSGAAPPVRIVSSR